MDKKQFLSSGLLEQYVLGLTDPDETQKVEYYLDVYPELQTEVEEMRKAIEQYALEQAIPPPPHLKSRIIKNIEATGAAGPETASTRRLPMPRRPLIFTAGAAVLLLAVSMILYQKNVSLTRDYQTLSAEFAIFREQCEQKNQKSEAQSRIYAFLKDAATRPVMLHGTTLAPEAEAIVYWNEQDQQVLINPVNLPAPPPGKQYQIWADVDGKMINMGLLEPQGTELQRLTFINRAESFNITVEPAGGSAEPTVALLLANGEV